MAVPLQSQTFNLVAGWNAVYLEVAPTNADPAVVLRGLPLDSAWAFTERLAAVDFIQDAGEPVWNLDRWSFFVPTNRPEARFNRLSAFLGNQSYLIKLTNAATWTVTGRPQLPRIEWQPDAYNFLGFPLDPAAPPTFQTFFRPSAAHFNPTTQVMQPIYRLNPSGQWTVVTPSTVMKAGEAFWIFCKGASDFQAPLRLNLDLGRELDFADFLDTARLEMVNLSPGPVTFTLRDVSAPAANALAYATFNPTNGISWPDFPTPLAFSASTGTNLSLRLALRRTRFAGTNYDTVISINNGAGVRYLLPVSARKSALAAVASQNPSPANEARGHAGLWIGSATLTGVSEAHSGSLQTNGFDSQGRPLVIERIGFNATPKPVSAPLDLRLLVHVDTNGTARLLKEVIQMWQDGTTRVDADGNVRGDQPGHYVLLTDTSLIPRYRGIALRDGVPVGRRFSTATFEFPGATLPLTGTFAINQTLRATNLMVPEWPTNPFRHKYHPDHKDPDQSFAVTRVITLQPAGPTPNAPPDYGDGRISGTYSETVTGLHRTNIVVNGTFTLTRVSKVGVLNQ